MRTRDELPSTWGELSLTDWFLLTFFVARCVWGIANDVVGQRLLHLIYN